MGENEAEKYVATMSNLGGRLSGHLLSSSVAGIRRRSSGHPLTSLASFPRNKRSRKLRDM